MAAKNMDTDMEPDRWHIAALYHFTPLAEPAAKQPALKALCHARGIMGTLLLAPEGINGTIAGPDEASVKAVIGHIEAWPEIPARLDEVKYAIAPGPGFSRMKVRLKKEIVTMHRPHITADGRGTYVEPADWNALIARNDVMVIDTRNRYETRIGAFRGANDPGTGSFGEFPAWADRLAAEAAAKKTAPKKIAPKKIAMYCTGGIRCEKASAYMKSLGFGEVYHLRGGILKYLEEIPENESLWQGECFVFDDRVSVVRNGAGGIEKGNYHLCHACKEPLSAADRAHADFEAGVSCPHCRGHTTEARRARFRDRQRQIELARKRGEPHMGAMAQKQKQR